MAEFWWKCIKWPIQFNGGNSNHVSRHKIYSFHISREQYYWPFTDHENTLYHPLLKCSFINLDQNLRVLMSGVYGGWNTKFKSLFHNIVRSSFSANAPWLNPCTVVHNNNVSIRQQGIAIDRIDQVKAFFKKNEHFQYIRRTIQDVKVVQNDYACKRLTE
jgi:hypothetical protein